MRVRVREFRKEKGWTLQDLAERVGTTAQTVQRLETDNMTVSTDWLERFGAALDVDPLVLITSDEANKAKLLGELGRNGRVSPAEDPDGLVPMVPDFYIPDPVAVRIVDAVCGYEAGSVLIFSRLEGRNIDNMLGQDGLACASGGEMMFGRFVRGNSGRFTIVPSGPGFDVWYDQELAWAAKPALHYKVY